MQGNLNSSPIKQKPTSASFWSSTKKKFSLKNKPSTSFKSTFSTAENECETGSVKIRKFGSIETNGSDILHDERGASLLHKFNQNPRFKARVQHFIEKIQSRKKEPNFKEGDGSEESDIEDELKPTKIQTLNKMRKVEKKKDMEILENCLRLSINSEKK